ncbi:MAG: PstS family phosphate ABC transporter substrate-binding protein [Trueperaceae bacterium]|nr:PstS family phosphate ABC transporter substrate-binding protein [Trueperaceae bacterium]
MNRLTVLLSILVLGLLASTAAAQSEVRWDGSSTVYPVSLAIAEEFQFEFPDVRDVSVAFSGTGAGFEKFCRGETDATGASRPIKASEVELCEENGIEFIETPVAADGLSVMVNPDNDFVQCLTVDELNRLWRPDSDVSTWADIRADWPAEEIELYGAGTDSGTFDYFTEAINGDSGAIRTDFFPSEDDNVLVQGIAGNVNALGFFGYAYYLENVDRLKLVAVDGGDGCIEPSAETIASNTYVPLSRPLFEYWNLERVESNPTVAELGEFAFSPQARGAIAETGYLVYDDAVYEAILERFDNRVTGTAFLDFQPGDSVVDAVRSVE